MRHSMLIVCVSAKPPNLYELIFHPIRKNKKKYSLIALCQRLKNMDISFRIRRLKSPTFWQPQRKQTIKKRKWFVCFMEYDEIGPKQITSGKLMFNYKSAKDAAETLFVFFERLARLTIYLYACAFILEAFSKLLDTGVKWLMWQRCILRQQHNILQVVAQICKHLFQMQQCKQVMWLMTIIFNIFYVLQLTRQKLAEFEVFIADLRYFRLMTSFVSSFKFYNYY